MMPNSGLSAAPPAMKVSSPTSLPARKRTAGLSLDAANTPQEVKSLILGYMEEQSAVYGRAAAFNIAFAHGSTILIMVLGLVASISAAMSFAANTPPSWQLVVFPASCSILAALNLQFQFEKLARTRELCRIAIEELKCKAYLMPVDSMDIAMPAAIELLESIYQLERDQVAEVMPRRLDSGDSGQVV